MPALRAFLDFDIDVPSWMREPTWWRPLTHFISAFVLDHQAGGLFFVIFFEELGVPLPAPGDVAIIYGGYLTTTGAIPTRWRSRPWFPVLCWEAHAT
jgi:hypothetical protein